MVRVVSLGLRGHRPVGGDAESQGRHLPRGALGLRIGGGTYHITQLFHPRIPAKRNQSVGRKKLILSQLRFSDWWLVNLADNRQINRRKYKVC